MDIHVKWNLFAETSRNTGIQDAVNITPRGAKGGGFAIQEVLLLARDCSNSSTVAVVAASFRNSPSRERARDPG